MQTILGVTGSVASIYTSKLYDSLSGDVKVVATKSGSYFLKQSGFNNYLGDNSEWPDDYKIGDPILHIELRKSADVLVIAPLDANTLAKIVHGICDNLLTCIVRAWDWHKPMILAPAMNTQMYLNPPTDEQLRIMRQRGAIVIDPVEKTLACGDVGLGAMADHSSIIKTWQQVIS